MSNSSTFLILEGSGNAAIAWAIHQMGRAGLQALCTFDLQLARPDPAECSCPHHGTDRCNCQMMVLLVYRDECQPVTLVAHSSDGWTWFSMIDTPQQRADPRLERLIRQALSVESVPASGLPG